jgi:mutator protein MutT
MTELVRVLAAVIRRDGRYLLALRPFGKRHAGRWEFPGGKVETGETDHQAMTRELREELDVTVRSLGRELCTRRDGESVFEIVFVEAHIDGEPRALEHVALAWVAPHELSRYPLAPSDVVCAEVLTGQPVVPAVAPVSVAQHEAYLEGMARDAMGLREADANNIASYLSYLEYAARLDSVREAARVVLEAFASAEPHHARRVLLQDSADRIAALPPTPRPAPPPPPPPPPAWPVLTHLSRGDRVVVRTAFRDFDHALIEAGRELTFSHYTFFPYDDGYTFYFERGGFRLSGNEPDQADVLANHEGRYFARMTVDEPDDGSGAAPPATGLNGVP